MCHFAVKSCLKLCINLLVLSTITANYENCETEQIKHSTECYFDTPLNKDIPIENGYLGTRDNSIYFIETSCSGELNFKQACAVEAAARTNDKRKIYILFAGFVKSLPVVSWPLLHILHNYANVEIFQLDVNDYLKGTPFEFDHRKGTLRERLNLYKYMPDILPFVTLNKYGGIYVDMDTIIIKRLDDLPEHNNFVTKQDGFHLGTAVIGLAKTELGASITGKILRLLNKMLPTETVSSILSKVCFGDDKINCDELEIYDSKYFYPIEEKDKEKYYRMTSEINPTESAKLYAFHIWGARDSGNVYVDSFYGFLMKEYCPLIFKTYSSKQKTNEKRRKKIFNDTHSNTCSKIDSSNSKKTKHRKLQVQLESTAHPASKTHKPASATDAATTDLEIVYLKNDEYQ